MTKRAYIFTELENSDDLGNDYYMCNMLIEEARRTADVELLKEAIQMRIELKKVAAMEGRKPDEGKILEVTHSVPKDLQTLARRFIQTSLALMVSFERKMERGGD